MGKKIMKIDKMNTLTFRRKRHSWVTNSTWIMLLLVSTLLWQCEKDTFEGETINPAPEVISSDPANNASNIHTNKIINATFNVDIIEESVNRETFSVKQGVVPVSGTVTYADKVATFTPAKPWQANKTYTGTITKRINDSFGQYPFENYIWSFSIGNVPVVMSTIPENSTSNIPLDQIILANFSTEMDSLSINNETFLVHQGDVQIEGVVIYTGNTATFTPRRELEDNTVYTVTISISATDVAGNAMASPYYWSFSTAQTTFIITLSPDPVEGGSTSGGGLLNEDDETTVNATAATGFAFTNWTEGETIVSSDENYTFTATDNRTLVANFSINTFSLNTTASNGSVTISPNQTTFDYGTSVLLTAVPDAGYEFSGWSGDTEGPSNSSTIVMDSDKNIVANFTLSDVSSYTLNTTANNGTVNRNPNQTSYEEETDVQLTASPDTGYEFSGWNGDASGNNNPLTVTMNSNKNIIANFALIASDNFTLNVTAINGSVTKNPNSSAYEDGATVQLTATPNTGYEFTSWGGDASGNENPLNVLMDMDKEITANFTINTYTLTVISENGVVVRNPDQIEYNYGENVELTATANSLYSFESWSGDALGSNNPITVLMDKDKTITANYIESNISFPAKVDLGSAGDFAVLAGSGIFNTGVSTMINGDVGSFPTATINGLLPGNVNGTLYTTADPIVGLAKDDLEDAYNDAQSRSLDAISLPGQIGGLTLAPGLYVNSSTSGISGTGPNGILTLDAKGDANAVWIFKVGSTFITDAGTSIVLAGGAQAGNIYWSVGTSATLGTNSVFYGIILADQSITLTTGATLNGVAYARTASVTLDSNTVTKP